jgi:PP-loop superfamily ATP-utilizing enzyme
LESKIKMTEARINAWVDTFDEDGCYVSFSGGKDSTVLLDIVRNRLGYKHIPAVFVDVPTQYPELKEFVQTFDNVEIIKPKISFVQVCDKYGFPLISKEVSECVQGARKYLTSLQEELESVQTDRQTDRQT